MSVNKHEGDGKHQPRVEDDYLLRGLGHFADDVSEPNQAYAIFVRSPHACARIASIDAEAARAAPQVLAVLTAAELPPLGNILRHPPMTGRNRSKIVDPLRPALAKDQIRHLGEPVAVVVAETLLAAQDAAELVTVDYEEKPSVVDVRAAVQPAAPQLWPEAPGNISLDWPGPVASDDNEKEVARIVAGAANVARVSHVSQRLVVSSMETRGGTGSYDAAKDSYTLRVCSQGAGPMRDAVASTMQIDKSKLRVITEDTGGAFGLKSGVYPEYPVLLVAAKTVGRPVHWMATRSEAFLSDQHARDAVTEAELAVDEKGKFLALRIRHLVNMGAYLGSVGVHIQTNNFARCFPCMYRIPKIDIGVRAAFTNTVPTGPYRGAGRPEANFVLERVVEEAARMLKIAPAKLRKRNLIPRSAMPYKTPVGTTYDSGDFPAIFEQALTLGGYDDFKTRRRESKKRGKLRGLGISCFLEHSGGTPTESALLAFPGNNELLLGCGVGSTGQGHATVFPRIVAERLGIKPEQIRHRQGDSGMDLSGAPSVGSRSATTVSNTLVRAVDMLLEKGKTIAAQVLEAAEADIGYRNGNFEVVGTDRRLTLFEVADRAKELKARGEIADTLDTRATVDTPQTFPNGVHLAEVEIDPDSGEVTVISYTAVDDCGTILDSTIVHGQIHGALAQGLGQALLEHAIYDEDSGQLVSGSFMDYAMPRAHHMPAIADANHPVPCTTNAMGVKGVGEAGTTASIAAIMNAIADAIPGEAAARMEMPATMDKVWKACQAGSRAPA